ncbi:MAG: hypothetical protein ACOC8D_03000, partial [bacterium]
WVMAGIGPAPAQGGFFGQPAAATLDGLDRALSREPPAFLVVNPTFPDLGRLPSFGPLLRSRYREVAAAEDAVVYRRVP